MKLILLQPYDFKQPGSMIELPDGIASAIVLRRVARQATEQETKMADTKKVKKK